jgi:hydrogenase maturation protein HypF
MSSGRRIAIQGTVQGVGFRPWVYRLAHEEGVAGTVRNDPRGVTIEAFGSEASVGRFIKRLSTSPPPAAIIKALASELIEASLSTPVPGTFAIVSSEAGAERQYAIPPDLATCPDCLREVFSPDDRRFRYPFTNCTNCGPRFTIARDLPYDRPATTMAGFEMCPACKAEYENPLDRRFHAQPNACRFCGPRLELLDAHSVRLSLGSEAMLAAALGLRRGWIIAIKGLGGFQLMAMATDEFAVKRLRARKHRSDKPLAIMVRSLDEARRLCEVTPAEAELLTSPAAPIVLLTRRPNREVSGTPIAAAVAPGNPRLGVMLPTTALHHLFLSIVHHPVVATSGNLADEPICIDNGQAIGRLGSIADLFLVHDRPIARHTDDSVVLVSDDETQLLRRARGYAPQPITVERELPDLLAVGAHMKNVVGVSQDDQVVLSQHIGDMDTPQAIEAFEAVIADLLHMLDSQPIALVHDLHPDYPSTRWARGATASNDFLEMEVYNRLRNLPTIAIQHHHAHLASCLADNVVDGPALGVTFDGTGYGTDGTVWGGEFLLGDATAFERVASLRPFRLLGGEIAVREPCRCALALLVDVFGFEVLDNVDLPPLAGLDDSKRSLFGHLLESGLRSPSTTSAGRLFDAVAAIVGLLQHSTFEGQAAMALEFAADPAERGAYPFPLMTSNGEGDPLIELDWRPMIEALVGDINNGLSPAILSARFHNGLAAGITAMANKVGQAQVALTGGCFQNKLLTHRTAERLEEAHFEVLLHHQVPANDGGIALGQILAATSQIQRIDPL